jgi:hypothetical protein
MKSEKEDLTKCNELSEKLIEELIKIGFPKTEFKQYCYQDDECGLILFVKQAVH